MRAGQLRHRITIEAPTGAQNEYGEPVEGWTPHATVWASREDLGGREYFAAQQTQTTVSTRFRIRFLAGISPAMRILSDGIPYDIEAVQDPDGMGRELVLLAVKEG
jgi:SPP1 family predicted phage head-tail adaptor